LNTVRPLPTRSCSPMIAPANPARSSWEPSRARRNVTERPCRSRN
jgi:hypothetical protein